MTPVVLESPYAGNLPLHRAYLRAALRECLRRGWSPYASHGLLTQPGVLDDDDPDERRLGLSAGAAWHSTAAATVVFHDLGVSPGMRLGIEAAKRARKPVIFARVHPDVVASLRVAYPDDPGPCELALR